MLASGAHERFSANTTGALLNLAERRGRHTVHTQMDFVIGFVLVPIVCALTLGQLGPETHGDNFFKQLSLAPVGFLQTYGARCSIRPLYGGAPHACG